MLDAFIRARREIVAGAPMEEQAWRFSVRGHTHTYGPCEEPLGVHCIGTSSPHITQDVLGLNGMLSRARVIFLRSVDARLLLG